MTNADRPVILEVALNGSKRKADNPHVPVAVEELTRDAVACLAAGAHIIHQHDDLGRPGELGGATPAAMAAQAAAFYRALYREVPHALAYPTSNWPGDIETRWGHQLILAREGLLRMAYVDPGSANIGAYDVDGRPRIHGSLVYTHSYADIAWMMEQCQNLSLAPNIAIFEPGFLRVVRGYEQAGALPRGIFLAKGDRFRLMCGVRSGSAFQDCSSPAHLIIFQLRIQMKLKFEFNLTETRD